MSENITNKPPSHLYAFSKPRIVARMLIQNGFDRQFLNRVGRILLGQLATTPFRLYESLTINPKVAQHNIPKDPVFIIGHWRSGTTFLHNLMISNAHYGYLTSFASFIFPCAGQIMQEGSKLNRKFRALKIKRFQDNVIVDFDSPGEEEFAFATMSPRAAIHGFIFRKHFAYYMDRYLILDNLDQSECKKWKRDYDFIIRKTSYINQGKQLLLKNPCNTARIKQLLELYPNAKFLHIKRNPYDVFKSTLNMLRKSELLWLEQDSEAEMANHTLQTYTKMMDGYLSQSSAVPEGQLAEISYEDLTSDPMEILGDAYEKLNLEGFEDAKPKINAFLESRKSYKKNQLNLDPGHHEAINAQWQTYFEILDYPVIPVEKKTNPSQQEAA